MLTFVFFVLLFFSFWDCQKKTCPYKHCFVINVTVIITIIIITTLVNIINITAIVIAIIIIIIIIVIIITNTCYKYCYK